MPAKRLFYLAILQALAMPGKFRGHTLCLRDSGPLYGSPQTIPTAFIKRSEHAPPWLKMPPEVAFPAHRRTGAGHAMPCHKARTRHRHDPRGSGRLWRCAGPNQGKGTAALAAMPLRGQALLSVMKFSNELNQVLSEKPAMAVIRGRPRRHPQ